MMAALFLIFGLVLLLIALGQRKPAIILTFIDLGLCLLMLWHHLDSTLKINW